MSTFLSNHRASTELSRRSPSSPTVAVFCRSYLPVSETFVRDHLQNLRRYQPTVIAETLIPDGLAVNGVPVMRLQMDRSIGKRIRRRLSGRPDDKTLRTAIERSRPALVHAHFGTSGVIVRDVCRRIGLPLVVTFHGFDATVRADERAVRRPGSSYTIDRRQLLHDAAAVITCSQYLAGRLVEQGAPAENVHVIPNGVDMTRFHSTPVPDTNRVLYVGRLVEKKGCEDLLRATALGAPHARIAVIGEGHLRPQLSRLASDLGVSVDFLGAQPHGRVIAEMRRARVVAVPSRTAMDGDQEGLPVASLEAAASGRPVVGYRHSGIPESVVDGYTGLLADEGDVAGLAAILAEVLDDHAGSQRMGTRARARAERLFDQTTTTARIEHVYDRVLGATGPRPITVQHASL